MLAFAAEVCAYYSDGRAGGKVPVDYCERKYVKKPGGAKPGMVIYENNRTAYVDPDPLLAQRLAIKR